MKSAVPAFVLAALGLASVVAAQTPSSTDPNATQKRPDARYSNPSGQDSAPSTTTVKSTKTAPPTGNPEKSQPETTGKASRDTYTDGKKRDDAAGCSTPTDAKSAQSANRGANNARTPGASGKGTVCTTSGEEGKSTRMSAKDAAAKKSNEPATPTEPKANSTPR